MWRKGKERDARMLMAVEMKAGAEGLEPLKDVNHCRRCQLLLLHEVRDGTKRWFRDFYFSLQRMMV